MLLGAIFVGKFVASVDFCFDEQVMPLDLSVNINLGDWQGKRVFGEEM